MKTYMEWNELSIPTYALSYLINGDDSGIDEKDKRIIDDYMREFHDIADKVGGHVIIELEDIEADPYFTWHPEFGLACTCVACTIIILVPEED